MSSPAEDADPPSPEDLPGTREARVVPRRASPSPDAIQPVSSYPGEARARPDWARRGKAQPVTGYPGEASSWPVLDLAVSPKVEAGSVGRYAEPLPLPPPGRRSGRAVRLLTLDRDRRPRRPPLRADAGRGGKSAQRDTSRPLGLQDWMTAMLQDRSSLQLDTTNICMVLHTLWKKQSRRQRMLRDSEFRHKAFNAFVMDVLKAYQKWEMLDDGNATVEAQSKVKKRKLDDAVVIEANKGRKREFDDTLADGNKKGEKRELNDAVADEDNNEKKRELDDTVTDEAVADDNTPDPFDGFSDISVADEGEFDVNNATDNDPDWRETSPDPASKSPRKKAGKAKPGRPRGKNSKTAKPKSGSRAARSPRKKRSASRGRRTRDQTDGLPTDSKRRIDWCVAVKDRPVVDVASEDLCARVSGPMMRMSGRKAWRNDAVLTLARRDEDASSVPDTAFLFIRCCRCPELVFTDYPAIRRHWDAKCHFLSCVLCDMIFNTARIALAHLRVAHQTPVPDGWFRLVRCHPCQRAGFYSTEQVISHMASHRAERARNPATFPPFLTCFKRIRCNQCGLMLCNHRTELEDHYKRDPRPPCQHSDPTQPPPVTCPACRRVWAGPAALSAHIRISRGACKEAVQPLSVRPSKGRSIDRAFCPVCSRAMDPGEMLADHLMSHLAPGLRCVQCGVVVGSHAEMKAHLTFIWRCDCSACDTHVGRGVRLLQHIIEDHDGGTRLTDTARPRPARSKEDRGVCPVCGKSCRRVKDHMNEAHNTRFCPCCNKEVKVVTYRNHMAKIRNLEKWRCPVCAREMSSGWALRTHMRLHTGEKPYTCDHCDAAYAQKVVLKTHMKTVHGILWPAGAVTLPMPPPMLPGLTSPVAVTAPGVTEPGAIVPAGVMAPAGVTVMAPPAVTETEVRTEVMTQVRTEVMTQVAAAEVLFQ